MKIDDAAARRDNVLRLTFTAAAVIALVVVTAAQQQPQAPDLIVTNANVITMDEQRPRATALAVRDGRFVAVGSDAKVAAMRGAKTRTIDARGQTVITGLNDSHMHVVREARFYNLELRWDGVGRCLPYMILLKEQKRKHAPIEAFLAERGTL